MIENNPYAVSESGVPAAFADESARATFIRKTYTHLFGAILALVGIEVALFSVVPLPRMMGLVQAVSPVTWMVALVIFMAVSWIARRWAESGTSSAMQYFGLGLYVVAEALLLFPLLIMAVVYVDAQTPILAAIVTLAIFGGLTAYVFVTRANLSWMGGMLAIGGIAAMAVMFVGMLMGFSLGLWFSAAMVALASGYILYDTSNILHHYRTEQHVAASLALFASVALLFWYVLRIMMAFAEE